MTRYDRDVLVDTLIYHQRTDTSGCHCGWAVLGASYAEHVANVYEAAAATTVNRQVAPQDQPD